MAGREVERAMHAWVPRTAVVAAKLGADLVRPKGKGKAWDEPYSYNYGH